MWEIAALIRLLIRRLKLNKPVQTEEKLQIPTLTSSPPLDGTNAYSFIALIKASAAMSQTTAKANKGNPKIQKFQRCKVPRLASLVSILQRITASY